MRKLSHRTRGRLFATAFFVSLVSFLSAQPGTGIEVRATAAGSSSGQQVYALDLWVTNRTDAPLDLHDWTADFQRALGEAFVAVVRNPVVRSCSGTAPPPRVDQRFDGTAERPFLLRDPEYRLPVGASLRLRVDVETAPHRVAVPTALEVFTNVQRTGPARALLFDFFPMIVEPARGFSAGRIATPDHCGGDPVPRTEVVSTHRDGSATLRHTYEDACGNRLVQLTRTPGISQRALAARTSCPVPVFTGLLPWGMLGAAATCQRPSEAVGQVN